MDFIGFIITLLAIIYLFFQKRAVERVQQEPAEDEEEEESLREFENAVAAEKLAREAAKKVIASPKVIAPPKKPKPLNPPLAEYTLSSTLAGYSLESDIESRKLKSSLESRKLKSQLTPRYEEVRTVVQPFRQPVAQDVDVGPSRAELAIRRLSKRSDLIIYQEIMNKPKSLR